MSTDGHRPASAIFRDATSPQEREAEHSTFEEDERTQREEKDRLREEEGCRKRPRTRFDQNDGIIFPVFNN